MAPRIWWLALAWLALGWPGVALAVTIHLEARVLPDLRVEGTLRVEGAATWSAEDPLARLPQPEDDITLYRTFPGAEDRGELVWSRESDEVLRFTTRLPRRFGATGALTGDGLWANGGWYPVVLVEGQLVVADWQASVTLPPHAVGVLNGQAGEGSLAWTGRADRLALAVLPGGRISNLDSGLVLVERGITRSRRDEELVRVWRDSWPPELHGPRQLVVVEMPDLRRLVRAGPGVLFLSDLAFRVSPPLYRYHRRPVARGMLQAALPVEDPWGRDLAAAAFAARYGERLDVNDATGVVHLFAFLPWVDALLYSGNTSFHAELFGETFPGDPLGDDLAEVFAPRVDGQVLATKLDDLYGPGTADAIARQLVWGASLAESARKAGVDPAVIELWRRPYPDQDLKLSVGAADGVWSATVRRLAPADAPPEPLVLQVDRQRLVKELPAGSSTLVYTLGERPRRVVLDPDGHVHQSSNVYDRWPTRWTLVGTVSPESVNLSARSFEGVATARARRLYDTRNAFDAYAFSDEKNLFGVQLAYNRYYGDLLDRRQRPMRLTPWVSAALLSPSFRPTDEGRLALDVGLSFARDTRRGAAFPLSGTRLGASIDGGTIPGTDHVWASVGVNGAALYSPHPRVVLAGRLSLGQAVGDIDHRLYSLGGSSAMRGIPPGVVVGRQRVLAGFELRALPFRDLSVPLAWIYWLNQVQLHAGLEAGWSGQASLAEDSSAFDGHYAALGWTAGALVLVDGLGTIPGMAGITLAQGRWQSPGFLEPAPVQVLLRFSQEF